MSDIRDLIDMTQGGVPLGAAPQAVPQAAGTPVPTTFDPTVSTPPVTQAAPTQQIPPPTAPSIHPPAPTVAVAPIVPQAPAPTPAPVANGVKLGEQLGLPPFGNNGMTSMTVEAGFTPVATTQPAQPVAAPAQPVNPSTGKSAAEASLEASIFGTPVPPPPPIQPLQNLPGQPPLMPEAQPVVPTDEDQDFHDEWNGDVHDPDADDVDVLGAALGSVPTQVNNAAPTSPAPLVQPTPVQPAPSPGAGSATGNPPVTAGVPVAGGPAHAIPLPVADTTVVAAGAKDDETIILQTLMRDIESHVRGMWFHSGIGILTNHAAFDQTSKAHRAIRLAKWELDIDGQSRKVIDLPPQDILDLGTALSAHQIWIASMENEWLARFEVLGTEFDRLMMIKRETYPGTTKGEKEINAVKADANLRELRRQYFLAKAMKTLLKGMGDRFQQFENSFKRPADWKADEMRKNQNWTVQR